MADAYVRGLERELLQQQGAFDDRLTLAASLERVGRLAAAAEVLAPVADDPAARELVTDWPAWPMSGGDAGASCSGRAPLFEGVPRGRWAVRVAPTPSYQPFSLMASALGFVVVVDGGGFVVLDPLTGTLRWSHTSPEATASEWGRPAPRVILDGDEVLCADGGGLRRFDVVTGSPRGELPLPPGNVLLLTSDRLVVSRPGEPLEALAFDGGAVRSLWRCPDLLGRELDHMEHGWAAGDVLVLGRASSEQVLVDPATGAVGRDVVEGCSSLLVDEHGVLVTDVRGDLRALDAAGELAWEAPQRQVYASDGELVVARDIDEAVTVLLDRATGAERARLEVACGTAAVLPDALLVAEGSTLTAFERDGAPRWRIDVGAVVGQPQSTIWALAVTPGRVYVRLDSDIVVCLAPSTA